MAFENVRETNKNVLKVRKHNVRKKINYHRENRVWNERRRKSGQNAFRGWTKSFISVTIIHHQSLVTGVKNKLLKCINVKYVNQRIQVFNKSLYCLEYNQNVI